VRAARLERGRLAAVHDAGEPRAPRGWALVQVAQAGICGTDLALARGMYGFEGIPGHELVGTVRGGPARWRGARVTADINVTCGRCAACRSGRRKHCDARRVLGIRGLDGAFAELLAVPERNLHRVPDRVDDDAAVFAEPLAAAMDACRQLPARVPALVVGPGRLGQLVVRVLRAQRRRVHCLGRGRAALAALPPGVEAADALPAGWERRFEAVVDCAGAPAATRAALAAVRPRGTLVLKGTHGAATELDLGRVVVDEVRIAGSRCGRIEDALGLLASARVDPRALIRGAYPLERAGEAFAHAANPGSLKILLRP